MEESTSNNVYLGGALVGRNDIEKSPNILAPLEICIDSNGVAILASNEREKAPPFWNWLDWSYALDWVLGGVLVGLSQGMKEYIKPLQLSFKLDDPTIMYRKLSRTHCPMAWVYLLCLLFVPSIIILYNVEFVLRRAMSRKGKKPGVPKKVLSTALHDTHHALLGIFVTFACVKFFTELLKNVGRLRPDFLDRCDYDIDLQMCTGSDLVVTEGRKSFPSGKDMLDAVDSYNETFLT